MIYNLVAIKGMPLLLIMYNNFLFVVVDLINNGYKPEFLDIITIVAVLFGISVIIINNPISSLLCLIGLFSSTSVYLISIGLNFIGFSYLVVYIGAVSILFLFILMLINIRESDLVGYNVNSLALALIIIVLLNYTWHKVSPDNLGVLGNEDTISKNLMMFSSWFETFNYWGHILSSIDIMLTVSNNWDGSIIESGHIVTIGSVMYTTLNTWLLLASLILLLAMVGCISIIT